MLDVQTLRDYEARGRIKSSTNEPFTVWCYTKQCVYERAWDDVTRACRGLVLHEDGTLVSRPFMKFHNWGEPEAVIETGPFLAYDKMDGTLIVIGQYEGQQVVSTKGSFDTWHSQSARELSLGFTPPEGYTATFELIHPDNRIVVNYGDYKGLVFLGAIDNETGADYLFPDQAAEEFGWHGDVVIQRSFRIQSMLNTIQDPEAGENREGFVVVWHKADTPSNRVKLKFVQYVALHGIYTGLTNRRVWEHVVAGTMDELYELAPDELWDDIRKCENEISDAATSMFDEAQMIAIEAGKLGSRRESAEYIHSHSVKPISGLAFMCLDYKFNKGMETALTLARPAESRMVGAAGLA